MLQYKPGDEYIAVATVNEDLNHILSWANTWRMTFNIDKTCAVNFRLNNLRNHTIDNIIFNNSTVQLVNTVKHLGFHLSYDQVSHLIGKTNTFLGLFRRSSFFF